MRGSDVLAAQRALRSLGASNVEPDGLFGPMTAAAVQVFRLQQRLPDSDVLDQEAWTRLFSEPAAAAPAGDLASLVKQLSQPQQYRDSVTWRLSPTGIAVETAPAIGTPGEPVTVRTILSQYGAAIADSCNRHQVPGELVIATIAVESSGKADARREEPGWISDDGTPDKVSVGLMQTLIGTARGVLGKSDIDAKWLTDPFNSIEAGTAYIAQQRPATGFDPPKVGCAYNAGSLQYNPSPANRWRMLQYPIGTSVYADRLIAFFNDAFGVLRSQPWLFTGPSFAAAFPRQTTDAAVDPLVEKLNLRPIAREAAYELKRRHPQIVFTSGRRDKMGQARAMAENCVGHPSWISETYAPNKASQACQKWVLDNPQAQTVQEIAAGLLSVMNVLTDTELGQMSRHLSGDAFDIQPIEPDDNNVKGTIGTLSGLRHFFDKEGGLVRWHAEFNA
jgi:peptidoglycan hydrolase-like protein with peptidoglycan-binding domain